MPDEEEQGADWFSLSTAETQIDNHQSLDTLLKIRQLPSSYVVAGVASDLKARKFFIPLAVTRCCRQDFLIG